MQDVFQTEFSDLYGLKSVLSEFQKFFAMQEMIVHFPKHKGSSEG